MKEFADVTKLDGRLPNTPASCVYLEGRDFSTHEIKTDWDKRIENGELSLGKPCHPQKNKPNF